MSTRAELLAALEWPIDFKRPNLTAARLALVPAHIVFDRFGWASHPERDGWLRWSTFGRDGSVAVAEARAESPMLLIRAPGQPSTVVCDRAHLLAEACRLAEAGFGVMPCVDELLALSVWLALDAAGRGNDAGLALMLLLGRAELPTEGAA
ncbi:hypothetical protein KTD19_12555 [Burkholderia multivorans]|uniref:hypothetical protein n=1 Tax=Burkholderia multivorans TaxID=87883 RepID=UPI0012DDBE5E|nr:hypothetical protein [Burkholderia multivorans]MBU9233224.1 hypothetical protein [Burkholderia multivorans]QGR95064.1 hypothetical protein FOC30_30070 [Burkholderia multivorans]HEF4735534.1 hypothetical protein [Burkholderia multivorans]